MKKIFTVNINTNNKENNKWSYFEDRVKLIYTKIRSEVKIANFMNILNEAILPKDQNNVKLSA